MKRTKPQDKGTGLEEVVPRKIPNGLDLADAKKLGASPGSMRNARRWYRAFRILVRWAEEPCTKKEFDKRIKLCRNVLLAIRKYEARRAA